MNVRYQYNIGQIHHLAVLVHRLNNTDYNLEIVSGASIIIVNWG